MVDILMYHSVSNRGGPTCIPASVFAAQVDAIAASGVPVVTLDDLVAARAGGPDLPPHGLILTFDDGFQDFADSAWPVLDRHGFGATVYLPTAFVGTAEGWRGGVNPPRALMGWRTIRTLAAAGVTFGSHSRTHPDLTGIDETALGEELAASKAEIEERLGTPVRHFAAPYGATDARVRAAIAGHYATAVGTALGRAGAQESLHDLPRLEMFYFTDLVAWRRHLAGRGAAYLWQRRLRRQIGRLVRSPW